MPADRQAVKRGNDAECSVGRWFARLVAVLVLAGLVWGGWRYTHATEEMVVRTSPVTAGPLSLTVTATGRLAPTTEVFVGCEVSSAVEELRVGHNDMVRRGDVIARLKPELYRAEYQQAQAELARAEAQLQQLEVHAREAQREFERVRGLFQTGAASEHEFKARTAAHDEARANIDAGKAAVQMAQSRVELAKYRLDRTVITAPIDGVVLDRRVDVGQTLVAALQTPVLFVLAGDLSRMELLTDVSEADVGFIIPGQEATFTVNAFRDRVFRGRVRQIRNQPSSSGTVVTYTVVITVANPDRLLRPGMPADVSIEIIRRDPVLKIANGALRFRPPLPPDEVRRLLDGIEWPAAPPSILVTATQPASTGPSEMSIRPPPIDPSRATLWQLTGASWRPVPVWTMFTDNRETAIAAAPEVVPGMAFASEVAKKEASESTFQKAIMLTRPENRKL